MSYQCEWSSEKYANVRTKTRYMLAKPTAQYQIFDRKVVVRQQQQQQQHL